MAHGHSMVPPDPLLALYHHKTLQWKLAGCVMRLAVPRSVFSTFQIDRGTQRLLRAIAADGPDWDRVLDVGCGYGAISVYLAMSGLAGHVDAIEPDALALAFAAHNAAANDLPNVAVRGAVAYDNVPRAHYDAIITNLPAKAGPEVHRAVLLGAAGHLRPGGVVWLVAVEKLAEAIDGVLADDRIELRKRIGHKGHVVYSYAFRAPVEPPSDPYLRGRAGFAWQDQRYTLDCLYGLPDFDSLGWAADAVIALFARATGRDAPRRIAVCNPSQGHLAVLAARVAGQPEEVFVLARDYLALRATRVNLLADGCRGVVTSAHTPALHAPGARAEVVLAVLREKEGMAVNVEKIRQVTVKGTTRCVIVGCRAPFGGTLAETLRKGGVSVRDKRRVKGAVALLLYPGG